MYEFSSFTLPAAWTLGVLTDRDGDGIPDPDEFQVQSPGHPLDGLGAPLVVHSTGDAHVFGTIDVSGQDGPVTGAARGPVRRRLCGLPRPGRHRAPRRCWPRARAATAATCC